MYIVGEELRVSSTTTTTAWQPELVCLNPSQLTSLAKVTDGTSTKLLKGSIQLTKLLQSGAPA